MSEQENYVRELTFEEEAKLYEEEAYKIFSEEKDGGESPFVNQILRRGIRIIRKARERMKSPTDATATTGDAARY